MPNSPRVEDDVGIRAATTLGRLKTEVREYPFPEISPDAGLLRVETAGVCGSDWNAYNSERPARIMGHENVGHIYKLGEIAARRWLFAAAPGATPPHFRVSDLLANRLVLRPCRGHSYAAVELALQYISSGRFPLHGMATHRFGLNDVDLAVRSVGGCGAPGAIHVTVLPWE